MSGTNTLSTQVKDLLSTWATTAEKIGTNCRAKSQTDVDEKVKNLLSQPHLCLDLTHRTKSTVGYNMKSLKINSSPYPKSGGRIYPNKDTSAIDAKVRLLLLGASQDKVELQAKSDLKRPLKVNYCNKQIVNYSFVEKSKVSNKKMIDTQSKKVINSQRTLDEVVREKVELGNKISGKRDPVDDKVQELLVKYAKLHK